MKTRITAILATVLLSTSSVMAWDGEGHMHKSQAKIEAKDRIELAGGRLANLINANLK